MRYFPIILLAGLASPLRLGKIVRSQANCVGWQRCKKKVIERSAPFIEKIKRTPTGHGASEKKTARLLGD